MKRNFKLGLILGIAILMLLPVYARAQIILSNLQGCIAPGTVANITASQGDTISFVVTSRLPNLSRISDPDAGVTTFPNATNGTSTFTWPTGAIGANPAVAAGAYLAAFQAHNNEITEAEYLVVMITIISTGGSPPPDPTEAISTPTFTVAPTTGTTGQSLSFTASASFTSGGSGHTLQYQFNWGDVTTPWGNATQTHIYNTANTYNVRVQARCSTDTGVTSSLSNPAQIIISGSGGGGGALGTKTNPYKINKPTQVANVYIPENAVDDGQGRGAIIISVGSKIYFEVNPVGAFKVNVVFYSGAGTICKLTQTAGAYSSESCRPYTGLMDIVSNPSVNTKYLYAIDNSSGGGAVNDAVWVVMPFVP